MSPPMIVVAAGTSLKASQTQSAANGTSSELIRATRLRRPSGSRRSTGSGRGRTAWCRTAPTAADHVGSATSAAWKKPWGEGAPFTPPRQEALVSFRNRKPGRSEALFTRRTSRPREFHISDEELDFFAPNLDRSTGLSAHWLSSVPEWHRARRRVLTYEPAAGPHAEPARLPE